MTRLGCVSLELGLELDAVGLKVRDSTLPLPSITPLANGCPCASAFRPYGSSSLQMTRTFQPSRLPASLIAYMRWLFCGDCRSCGITLDTAAVRIPSDLLVALCCARGEFPLYTVQHPSVEGMNRCLPVMRRIHRLTVVLLAGLGHSLRCVRLVLSRTHGEDEPVLHSFF